jgi:hypothetical protein
VSVTRLPPGPEAYSFLVAHSAPDEPEMLSGLCLYTEVFLSKVRCWFLLCGLPAEHNTAGLPHKATGGYGEFIGPLFAVLAHSC